jgi:hypothetical protein
MARVKLDLKSRDVPNKVEFGRTVVTEMTTNAATFVSPDPSLADLTSVTDDLEDAYEASKKGLLSTAMLNDAEAAWDVIMTAMGNYVETVAKGTRAVINMAGMEIIEENHTALQMTKVEGVEGKSGEKTGEVFYKWKKVKGCRVYRGKLLPQNGSRDDEIEVFTTKTKLTIKDLTPGVKYFLVLEAIGASGVGAKSDSASAYAAF